MFRVGKNIDHDYVCGPDCPERPSLKRKPDEEWHTYRVGTTVRQTIEAITLDGAKTIARRNIHKRGFHDIYDSHAQQVKHE
jgi:hypothetical protein